MELSSRGGRQAYFAIARPQSITEDPRTPDHFYCDVADYLDFHRAVPFRQGEAYRESLLRRDDGGTNKGAFGRSVRIVPDDEFDAILSAGLGEAVPALAPSPAANTPFMGLEELTVPFERPMVELTTNRPFRDLAFRRSVRAAYDNRCAVTGLRLINGGGRPHPLRRRQGAGLGPQRLGPVRHDPLAFRSRPTVDHRRYDDLEGQGPPARRGRAPDQPKRSPEPAARPRPMAAPGLLGPSPGKLLQGLGGSRRKIGSPLKPDQVVLLREPRHERLGRVAALPVSGQISIIQPGICDANAPVSLHEAIDLSDPVGWSIGGALHAKSLAQASPK